jgi:putative Mg2+ transporter-C (MgtC) family protein
MEWNPQLQIVGEVALAIVLGGLIGLERETADKPAGLRTHMLIAGAAALLVGIGNAMLLHFHAVAATDSYRPDPLRIIEAIVTGISFLGAGTIIRHNRRQQIEGLTTAASMLFTGSLGVCVALQLYLLAIGVTILALVVLRGVGAMERRLERRRKTTSA